MLDNKYRKIIKMKGNYYGKNRINRKIANSGS